MFRVACDQWTLTCHSDGVPSIYGKYREKADLVEEIGLDEADGAVFLLAAQRGHGWPFLTILQRYSPTPASGFAPGVLVIAETGILFLGAGTRLLAYRLDGPERIWEDATDPGFWGWARHGDFVLMSAELELAAWDLAGRKLWSTYVEPPWDYKVAGNVMELDVMGERSSFPIGTGPRRPE